jgi:hypothetical protein
MFARLVELREALESVVGEVEREVLEAGLAARLVGEFAAMEKLCAAGKALAARRMAESGSWRRCDERSPAHWMARATGASVGEAVAVLTRPGAWQTFPPPRRRSAPGP